LFSDTWTNFSYWFLDRCHISFYLFLLSLVLSDILLTIMTIYVLSSFLLALLRFNEYNLIFIAFIAIIILIFNLIFIILYIPIKYEIFVFSEFQFIIFWLISLTRTLAHWLLIANWLIDVVNCLLYLQMSDETALTFDHFIRLQNKVGQVIQNFILHEFTIMLKDWFRWHRNCLTDTIGLG
jgi:hypothetical protein